MHYERRHPLQELENIPEDIDEKVQRVLREKIQALELDNINLTNRLRDKDFDFEKSNHEKDRIANQMNLLTGEHEANQREMGILKFENKRLKQENLDFKLENDNFHEMKCTLQSQIQSLKIQLKGANENALQDLEKLQTENEALKNKITEFNHLLNQSEELKARQDLQISELKRSEAAGFEKLMASNRAMQSAHESDMKSIINQERLKFEEELALLKSAFFKEFEESRLQLEDLKSQLQTKPNVSNIGNIEDEDSVLPNQNSQNEVLLQRLSQAEKEIRRMQDNDKYKASKQAFAELKEISTSARDLLETRNMSTSVGNLAEKKSVVTSIQDLEFDNEESQTDNSMFEELTPDTSFVHLDNQLGYAQSSFQHSTQEIESEKDIIRRKLDNMFENNEEDEQVLLDRVESLILQSVNSHQTIEHYNEMKSHLTENLLLLDLKPAEDLPALPRKSSLKKNASEAIDKPVHKLTIMVPEKKSESAYSPINSPSQTVIYNANTSPARPSFSERIKSMMQRSPKKTLQAYAPPIPPRNVQIPPVNIAEGPSEVVYMTESSSESSAQPVKAQSIEDIKKESQRKIAIAFKASGFVPANVQVKDIEDEQSADRIDHTRRETFDSLSTDASNIEVPPLKEQKEKSADMQKTQSELGKIAELEETSEIISNQETASSVSKPESDSGDSMIKVLDKLAKTQTVVEEISFDEFDD